MEHFFKQGRRYAVAGASTNQSKFGFKVLKWYVDRNLPVTPINYRKETILGLPSIENIKQIDTDAEIGLSVVTPPDVSLQLVKDIATLDGKVKAMWFQPGTWNTDVIEQAQKVVPVVIQDCVLMKGDKYLSKL